MSATELSHSLHPQSPETLSNQDEQPTEETSLFSNKTLLPVSPRYKWYSPIKAIAEHLLSVFLLIAAVPFVIVAAVAIKLTSPGPVFYRQTRMGKNGRHFGLIKLRTMVQDAEAKSGPVWSTKNDPRITKVGKFLRDSHIDEFPQLINVLLGQMLLIGPRPERPEIAEQLAWQINGYEQRVNIRPGITGLAQLKLPPDSDLESVQRKLQHDLYYIHCLNPWLDLKIFFVTAWILVSAILRRVLKVATLPNTEHVNNHVEHLACSAAELTVTSQSTSAD